MIRSKSPSKKKSLNYKKILKISILAILFLFGARVFYSVIITPFIKLKTVQIVSTNSVKVDSSKIKSIIGLDSSSRFPEINCSQIRNLLLNNMMLENVEVEKKFPDRLVLTMTPRVPLISMLIKNSKGKSSVAQIDKKGYLVAISDSIESFDYPILSGDLEAPNFALGAKLEKAPLHLLETLSQIQENNIELYRLISEISLKSISDDSYDLIFYIRGQKIPLMLKENFTAEGLLSVIGILDALKDVNLDKTASMLDFRSSQLTFLKQGEI